MKSRIQLVELETSVRNLNANEMNAVQGGFLGKALKFVAGKVVNKAAKKLCGKIGNKVIRTGCNIGADLLF